MPDRPLRKTKRTLRAKDYMAARSRRRGKPGGGCLRAFGFVLLLLAVACIGFVLYIVRDHSASGPTTRHSEQTSTQTHNIAKKNHSEKGVRHHKVEHPSDSEQPAPEEKTEDVKPEQPSVAPAEETSRPIVKPSHTTSIVPGDFARGDKNSPRIALTFDAGASPKPTPLILDTLAKHHVHATFFLTGKWISQNRSLTRRIADEGHEIGNHTYSHRSLTKLSAGEIAREADRTELLVQELTGRSTKPLLRVPFGARDKRVEDVIADLGYHSIYWDLDSWDSVKVGITPDEIEQRVETKIRNGSIVLMHCGSSATAEALDSILQKLSDAGYQQVTISELMK